MSARRLRAYEDELERILAERDLRMFDLMVIAFRGDPNSIERKRVELQRAVNPNAGVRIVTLEDLRKERG